MRIPSYDDLTPSIPDITPRETLTHVARILPAAVSTASRPASIEAGAASPSGAPLFACLRATGAPEAILATALDFSPRLQRHGPGCVVLDVSGLGRLLGDALAIGRELNRSAAERAPGIRVAVARTHTAARLMALARTGLSVTDGDVARALAPLPIDTLRALLIDTDSRAGSDAARVKAAGRGTSASRIDTFCRWGLATLGEVAALPASELSARMGQDGLVLQRLARGVDLTPLVADPDVPRFIQSLALEWPIEALEPLSFVLARLLDLLSAALERADRGAVALRLDLRLVDRTTHTRVLQLPAAIRDARVLRTLVLLDLESHPPAAAIDVVTIEIDPAPSRIIQYSLLERALPSPETLATLTARLSALVGETRCGSPGLLDTHRPDGFEMRRFAPKAHRKPASAAAGDPRLAPCEAPLLRRFRPPRAVRVTVEHGRPVRLAIDRRGMPGGPVVQLAGPWRTSGAWWDASGARWDRDEWDVALSDGSLCRLFRDRATERWFMDGVLD